MNEGLQEYAKRLRETGQLEGAAYAEMIRFRDAQLMELVSQYAVQTRLDQAAQGIQWMGTIDLSSYCKNDCYYCGIRRSNSEADRYRLSREDILACCREGWELGFRTFVLQGGEDGYYRDEWYEELIRGIKKRYPSCAVTLSVGERTEETYRRWYEAGADRYLLRHETADDSHYRTMHPEEMSPVHRKECLYILKEIGYQVGCGVMVGSPGQGPEQLAQDMTAEIARYQDDMLPAVILIPGKGGALGLADRALHAAVERAVGADIS